MKDHGFRLVFKLLACISFLYSSNIFALATCSPANCTAACEFNADTLNEIPFYVDSLSYTEIPATVEKKYKVCETKSGPSCGP